MRLAMAAVLLALVGAGAPAGEAAERCRMKPQKPHWLVAQRATVLVDSVLLGGVHSLRGNMANWRIRVTGRPAVMLKAFEAELRRDGRRIAPLAVVGVGYNSLWERGRRNYAHWAGEFDVQALRLVRTLKRQGAEQIVWVTLRQAQRSVIPSGGLWQFDKYAWYFPYVNERLRKLANRRGDVILADWAGVSDRAGLTYDAIHLNPDGAKLMARTIRRALEQEGREQTARSAKPAGCVFR